jgi:type II secretory pathway predicted ATPase ExeA
MVVKYYNLREQPFGVTPDARYLFLSATHREALGSLVYGLASGLGFVALIAKPGMGKTMLLFDVLSRVRNNSKVVFLFQTVSTPIDCMKAILTDLGVHETSGSLFDLQSRLNGVVAEESRSGKHLVIVFDEAQTLDDSVLEFVRMLSNFETSQEKLIQVILTGQPELADKLASPELLQLRQRISIVACLRPFSAEETDLYIDHRLRTAGYLLDESLFTAEARALIARSSQGIPRNINNLCFNALSLGCALKRKQIDGDIIREVVRDLDLESLGRTNSEPHHRDEERKVIDRDIVRETGRDLKGESFVQTKFESDHRNEERKIDEDIVRDAVHDVESEPLWQVSSQLPHSYEEWKPVDAGITREAVEDLDPEQSMHTNSEPNRADEKRAQEVPLFASVVSAPSPSWSRLAKIAVASAMLLGLGAYQFQVRGTSTASTSEISVQARPAPLTTPAPPAPLSDGPTLQLTPAVSTVQVTPGKSLYRICTAAFGTCNPELIQEIRKLNPRLSNPDHIESGQKLQLPAIPRILGGTESILEPAGMATPEKRDAQ